ncbi:hypothetical protein Fot_35341 [Forsythia ovata]|uniref:Uncharacterized protein n=1 Tax=Forsythia ovata TaxID=205694 RepID=A0ABD1SMB7_9LAMI
MGVLVVAGQPCEEVKNILLFWTPTGRSVLKPFGELADFSATVECYGSKVEDFKKKVDDLTSLDERLEAEVERRTKKVEVYKKNPEAKRLRADIHITLGPRRSSDMSLRRRKM